MGKQSHFQFQTIRKKAYLKMFASSVQIISGLDVQSKFQMFTLFGGSDVGVQPFSSPEPPFLLVTWSAKPGSRNYRMSVNY